MTNSKIRKTRKSSKDGLTTNSNDQGGQVEMLAAENVSSAGMANSNNEFLTTKLSDDDTDDADEVMNDDDTSTSFSLQECMNEFRARRIRRISQNRYDPERDRVGCGDNDATELDLINQNLCNKAHERKCKPCKDGFCYCFTSDSGDGGSLACTENTRGIQMRHSRRNRRTECKQAQGSGKEHATCQKSQEARRPSAESSFKILQKQDSGKCIGQNQMTAISRLETSQNDAPLIHIIQELRNNCVISEVRVNKHKLQQVVQRSGKTNNDRKTHITQTTFNKKAHFKDQLQINRISEKEIKQNYTFKSTLEPHAPTAPPLDKISELESVQTSSLDDSGRSKLNSNTERRNKSGGRLLKKRLSNAHSSYKPLNLKEPPPKPPRSSLSLDDKFSLSSTSTSPSVREAELVVDEFLAKKGFAMKSASAKEKKSKTFSEQVKFSKRRYENDKRKSYPMTPKELNKYPNKLLPTYPSLSDIERVVESKKSTNYVKNISQITENHPKVISIGWNERKINDMLNYDSNTKSKEFQSTQTKAQPQQQLGRDVVGFEEHIGWQLPPRALDNVDGAVRHNLASNFENKNTPVKTKLFSSNKSKGASQTQKFLWSEHLRNLSPWSNKQCTNNTSNVNPKTNLRCGSKKFLKSSKKKILRLVSPKKENKERINVQIRKTPQRNVGIQTSREDISRQHLRYEPSSTLQSPPGSYHSPVQSSQLQSPYSTQSQNTTPNGIDLDHSHFDFSRTVHSPPKKVQRISQRKLNFPLYCAATCDKNVDGNAMSTQKKSYRSFNTELDQDVSISKIGYILRNIRSKLEASDEQAIRTFRETERREEHHTSGFDCPDGYRGIRQDNLVERHGNIETQVHQEGHRNDPIYSEIEDNSIHITESPEFDNRNGIEHFNVDHKPEILYAKVNKRLVVDTVNIPVKQKQAVQQPTALAKIIHDSLISKKITPNFIPLPPLPEPPECETSSYSSPLSFNCQLLQGQSLNNVRVMEHNSPPKRQRNLSKSDLSLHRSEIFLENLCKSELIIDGVTTEREHLEKINNNKTNQSYISVAQPSPIDNQNTSLGSNPDTPNNDTVSYQMPNDVGESAESIYADEFTTAGSNLALTKIAPPSLHNQSTPKKQSFTTKDNPNRSEFNIDVMPSDSLLYNDGLSSMSCPNTPQKLNDELISRQPQTSHSHSLNEFSDYETVKNSNVKSISTLGRYKFFKNVLQKSFRKSKEFVKSESKRLSTSLSFSASNTMVENLAQNTHSSLDSNLDLEALFSFNETASISEQLTQTVSICRKLHNLKVSTEMIEAERLLLFSDLRREKQQNLKNSKSETMNQVPKMLMLIDDMYLPILPDVNRDIFFNYFYIVTFDYGGIIKSTHSAECQNDLAVFRDCGIKFIQYAELETNGAIREQQPEQSKVRCSVFMLRLRKVSTLSIEPRRKKEVPETCPPTPLSSLSSSTESSSSSSKAIVSRFRLHASFTLDSSDFAPYEYVSHETNNSDLVCARAASIYNMPLISHSKSTNLSGQIQLKGRAEVRFPKKKFAGFLNVEDSHSQHNWNRRWCTLEGIYLHVWQDVNNLNESPLISIDLRVNSRDGRYPLRSVPRELCARPRSFCLESTLLKAEGNTTTVFFAADTQDILDDWLTNINIVLDFIIRWLL